VYLTDIEAVARYVGVTAAGDQEGLQADAVAACQWVEDQAGPIEQRTVTERAWSSGYYTRLSQTPAAITSIDGVTDGLDALTLVPGGIAGAVTPGYRTVVYQVGSAKPPGWAVDAALAMTKHLWQARLGAKGSQQSIDYYARADALLEAHRRGPRP
jgi:hypothetical protein